MWKVSLKYIDLTADEMIFKQPVFLLLLLNVVFWNSIQGIMGAIQILLLMTIFSPEESKWAHDDCHTPFQSYFMSNWRQTTFALKTTFCLKNRKCAKIWYFNNLNSVNIIEVSLFEQHYQSQKITINISC